MAAQEGEQLLSKAGAPPRVDDEVGRRVDGEQEVREGGDLLDEGCVCAVATLADRLGRESAIDHLVDVRHDLGEHSHMTSAVDGERGCPPKVDKVRKVARILQCTG